MVSYPIQEECEVASEAVDVLVEGVPKAEVPEPNAAVRLKLFGDLAADLAAVREILKRQAGK